MLGKVVVHGPDREAARQALVAALDDTAVLGLTTNAGFLRGLAAERPFRDASVDTTWLDSVDLPAAAPRPDADLPRAPRRLDRRDEPRPPTPDTIPGGRLPAGRRHRPPTLVELDREVLVDQTAGTVDGVPVPQALGRGPRARRWSSTVGGPAVVNV